MDGRATAAAAAVITPLTVAEVRNRITASCVEEERVSDIVCAEPLRPPGTAPPGMAHPSPPPSPSPRSAASARVRNDTAVEVRRPRRSRYGPSQTALLCVNVDAAASESSWHGDPGEVLPCLSVSWLLEQPVRPSHNARSARTDAGGKGGKGKAADATEREAIYNAILSCPDLTSRALLACACGAFVPWLPALLVGRRAFVDRERMATCEKKQDALYNGEPPEEGQVEDRKYTAGAMHRINAVWRDLEPLGRDGDGVDVWRRACFSAAQQWGLHSHRHQRSHQLAARPRTVTIDPGRRWRGDDRLAFVCGATSMAASFILVRSVYKRNSVEIGYCSRNMVSHFVPARKLDVIERIVSFDSPAASAHWSCALAGHRDSDAPRTAALVHCRWTDGALSFEPLESLIRGHVIMLQAKIDRPKPTLESVISELFSTAVYKQARAAIGDSTLGMLMERGKKQWEFCTRQWARILAHEFRQSRSGAPLHIMFPSPRLTNPSEREREMMRLMEQAIEAWGNCVKSAGSKE